jgi:hypothetical protein
MTKTIEIIVTQDGKTTVQTRGFIGPSCQDASRFIERALGQCTDEKLTSEFHQSQPTAQQTQCGN